MASIVIIYEVGVSNEEIGRGSCLDFDRTYGGRSFSGLAMALIVQLVSRRRTKKKRAQRNDLDVVLALGAAISTVDRYDATDDIL